MSNLGKKIGQRVKLGISRMKGSIGEQVFVAQQIGGGKRPIRTGRGSDYKVGRTLYEIKTGTHSKLTPSQEKTKKKNPGRYKVVRMFDY